VCGIVGYIGNKDAVPIILQGLARLEYRGYDSAGILAFEENDLKHGPIALIDENMPVVVIAPQNKTYEKIIRILQELKARKGKLIAIPKPGDEKISSMADHVASILETEECMQPILSVIQQLLSYYVAVNRGSNVDQPRNLSKSVTVE